MARAADRAGVRRIATVSGLSAIRDEDSISRQVERDVEALGMVWTHLRPNFFMQNYHTVYRDPIRDGSIPFFTGSGRTSLVDARDVGAAAAAALLTPGLEALAADHGRRGPRPRRDRRHPSEATGREVRYTARCHDDTRAALRAAGLSEKAIEASVARFREVEADAFAAVSPALGDTLGRPPRSFMSYAREHAHYW